MYEKPMPPIGKGDAVKVQVFKEGADWSIVAWGTVIAVHPFGIEIEDSHNTRRIYPWHVVLEVESKL